MRRLAMTLLFLLLSTPVFAQSSVCHFNGPHNCVEQSEDALTALTQRTIHNLQLTQDPHPFKTKNDEVLQAYAARQMHAAVQPQAQPQARDYTFWR